MSNSGQKSHERASFVNLLSRYFKEKRNLGDFSVGISSKPDANGQQAKTTNFLSHVAISSESSRPNLVASTSNVKSSDFFPFGASSSKEDAIHKTDLRKPVAVEPKNAQLTMFFNGQVFVYNDFPADKVKEIMTLANQGSSTACSGVNVADSAMEKLSYKIDKTDDNSDIPDLNIASGTANTPAHDPSVERHQYGSSDLRIARRNSLHKFFEKRKDRAAARAPYQLINHRVSPPPPKPDGDKASYEEGQSSKETARNIDLNL
ncbi:Jasmonate-zim-domain protein 6, putative isoform 2 [Hibiscus syriacus]|uniref:Protein TIFY n=1 Tax=Hibiscus syriacus TaxID=106335 RepID=A0A6A2XIH9_HIBSY|nr:protein TIFY 11B-like [Hibiscus syriacus]XP_039032417.1 protein TIFY 11B-like [Hibiscus syriacus]KAE8675322.1 Jasmonate-zim-domain protein 6, putative isoform 2 [Hibiscus syriacus]